MKRSVLLSLLAALTLSGCTDRSASIAEPTEASQNITTQVVTYSRKYVVGMHFPGRVDSKGALIQAPVGFVFKLPAGQTAATFFRAIAGRTSQSAGAGQFFSPNSTARSYTATQNLLTKLATVSATGNTTSANGTSVTVATVTPAAWLSATQGQYKPSGRAVSDTSLMARIGYKDASGLVYFGYFSFAYKTTAIASIDTPVKRGVGAEGLQLLVAAKEALGTFISRAATVARDVLVPNVLMPTVAHAQVAAVEALAADAQFKVVNGNANGRGKRWFDSCNAFADYASGSYDALTEVPGTASRLVGASFTAFATSLVDNVTFACSL